MTKSLKKSANVKKIAGFITWAHWKCSVVEFSGDTRVLEFIIPGVSPPKFELC